MKNYTITWSDAALVSLRKIHDFIAPTNTLRAKKVVKSLYLSADTLSILPLRNPIEKSLVNEPIQYRFLLKNYYKIIYFIDNEEVVIVYIFDTRKNPTKLLIGE